MDDDVERYAGMTLLERVCDSGLLETFDAAVRRTDREELISICRRLALSDSQAAESVDAVLADPQRYGY
jgi:hypothetical protein